MNVNAAFNAVGLAALFAAPVTAFWRMPCPSRLVMERIDPIVSPGQVASHVHTVSGASGFGFETSYEQLRESACTSCPVKQDLSVYWTPNLYYMAKNGSYINVPQAGDGEGSKGGMTVYYEQRGEGEIEAFPPGLRMLAGTPEQRNATGLQAAPGQAVSFECLNYDLGSNSSLAMPNYKCPQGLRAQIFFPSCWDGIHNDTADHKSHMAYPIGHYDNGRCPDSHPKQLISIFYEVIYQTNLFDDWQDEHPFVFSMGDRTGYGFHGDFINGWNTTALQNATSNCNNLSGKLEDCNVFMEVGLYSAEDCQACMLPPSIDEQVTGVLEKLPGCNEPSSGPELAAKIPCPSTPIGQPETYFTDVTQSLDWMYAGCAHDNVSSRTLQGDFTSSNDMTVKMCVEYCKGKGYSLAGLEWAIQCYCDNEYRTAGSAPKTGVLGNCWQPCAGDSKEVCGGAASLSVYQACENGKPCTNSLFSLSGNSTSPANNPVYSNSPVASSSAAPVQSGSYATLPASDAPVQSPHSQSAVSPVSSSPPSRYSHSVASPPANSAPAHYSYQSSQSSVAPPSPQSEVASSANAPHGPSTSKAPVYYSVRPTVPSSSENGPASSSVAPASSSSAVKPTSCSGSSAQNFSTAGAASTASSVAYGTTLSNSTMSAQNPSLQSLPTYSSTSDASVIASATPASSTDSSTSLPLSSSAAPVEDWNENNLTALATPTTTEAPSRVSSFGAAATASDDCEQTEKKKRHAHHRRGGHGHAHY
ncbi:WSC-domain-containing protein [Acrodontium crateriforme]|uniref:WSC-domain-containing protein n=1 Tax=Acrodontium crateriforme TaxID=150365 RepID=A0AAQ3M736_9PEZI|nr:WSC-domain-containing protein [Acrodontium crateriforme]